MSNTIGDNKKAQYKKVFALAERFLGEVIAQYPQLNLNILEQHLNDKVKFNDIKDATCRLVESLTNRNMMSSVINFGEKKSQLRSILFDFDPQAILDKYKTPDQLLEVFKNTFTIRNIESKRNLWRIFSDGIISASKFMAAFKDKVEFDNFIKTFSFNKYTKAALPMLLDREIKGLGFALACDFLKELGYRDYPKPDVHLIKIFNALDLSDSEDPYEVYKSIIEMAETVGKDAYAVDKIFWLIGSGNFYLVKVDVGRRRDEFIKYAKKS